MAIVGKSRKSSGRRLGRQMVATPFAPHPPARLPVRENLVVIGSSAADVSPPLLG
ncbi:MAG TPA: hypothetical protein VHX86_20070 [Tepidisphaeraceae bacterium]|jgi:hypothetical protein|nr:hypothetical protein [Tepidisphaeraceae bacterium]